jgi:hypothetical protein
METACVMYALIVICVRLDVSVCKISRAICQVTKQEWLPPPRLLRVVTRLRIGMLPQTRRKNMWILVWNKAHGIVVFPEAGGVHTIHINFRTDPEIDMAALPSTHMISRQCRLGSHETHET